MTIKVLSHYLAQTVYNMIADSGNVRFNFLTLQPDSGAIIAGVIVSPVLDDRVKLRLPIRVPTEIQNHNSMIFS